MIFSTWFPSFLMHNWMRFAKFRRTRWNRSVLIAVDISALTSRALTVTSKHKSALSVLGGILDTLKMYHITRRHSENKICAYVDHHWSKKAHFFVYKNKRTGFVKGVFGDFVKMNWFESLVITRVESFGKKCESSRVTVISQCDSTRVINLSHAITASVWFASWCKRSAGDICL